MGLAPLLLLVACAPRNEGVGDGWYDEGEALDVIEPVAFTDQNYDFPNDASDGIGALLTGVFPVASTGSGADTVAWGSADESDATPGCRTVVDTDLPFTIEGVATAHPRFYFKTSGCDWDSDEKYYGSYFLQDRTGGVFILGDSKVAHFDMGDRIRVTVRAAKTSFDVNMVYSSDFEEIIERDVPIFYETRDTAFAFPADQGAIGRVFRVEGEVVLPKDTFGEFWIENDDGAQFAIGLDVELNRRGIDYPVGTRIEATGPLLYSFSTFTIVIMRQGQITVEP